jgi:hypothetical protein
MLLLAGWPQREAVLLTTGAMAPCFDRRPERPMNDFCTPHPGMSNFPKVMNRGHRPCSQLAHVESCTRNSTHENDRKASAHGNHDR